MENGTTENSDCRRCLLLRQFSRGTIDIQYMKKELEFGKFTNQYTFHTEKSLKYLKKAGVIHDKQAAGND